MSCCSVASFWVIFFPHPRKKQQTVPKENSSYLVYNIKEGSF